MTVSFSQMRHTTVEPNRRLPNQCRHLLLFQQSNIFKLLLLCLVVQVAEDMKEQYLSLLPLNNASEHEIEGLKETQMEVGNFVCVCSSSCVCMCIWSVYIKLAS